MTITGEWSSFVGPDADRNLGQWAGEEASLCAREQEEWFIPETYPDQGQATATGSPRCQWHLDCSS